MRRMRRVASAMLLVLAGTLFPLAVVANWARTTMFESDAFSERAVEPLRAEPVRTELARRMTEQLVRSGNQQAISFRPGFELAIQGVIDTDTFRSIFRNAVRKTHQAILQGQGGSAGLDLADSFAVITSSLQIAGGGQQGQQGAQALDHSLSDVTKRLDDLGVWELDETIDSLSLAFFLGSLAAAAGSILLAADRRRAVRRVGWAIVVGGAFIVALLLVLRWFVGRQISDAQLSSAIDAALERVTDDLRLTGLWIAVYGVVIAAAAASSGTRYTPAEVWRRTVGWIKRRRRTTPGTIALGAIGAFISIALIQDPSGNLELIVRGAGLWIGYLAVTEILRLVRTITLGTRDRRARWPRIAVIAGTLVVIVVGVTFAFVLSTRGAARAATASGEQVCNGKESLCDLTLDQVAFPGTHNSMSSSLYPGFLFGEQIGTISSQLNAGVRALLIDTHYGVQSTARLPGANSPLILTDKVAEVGARSAEDADPAAAKRAEQLASRAPKAADANRRIYLCHNNCELGAVEFDTALGDIKSFLDTHPDDVLMVIIQDATKPKRTAAAIEAAGLSDRVATLRPGEPLPTLGDLIEAGRTLVVFAERGAPGGPPWYHSAYEWFQETGYTFSSTDDFNCRPNRGPGDAPLFLINHWVSSAPPDPAKAAAANAAPLLEQRIETCIAERGLAPNIVAVDFAERGDLVSTVRSINETRLEEERARRRAAKRPAGEGAEPRREGTVTTPAPAPAEQLPPPPEATVITELTGGDPERFCPALPVALRTMVAWAEAILGEAPSDAGLTDLAYAPLLVQDVGEYVDTAPDQLAQRAAPILERARAAVASLRALGLDDRDIENLAKFAASALRSLESPDGVTVELELVQLLEKKVGAERLRAAAVVFSAGQPDPATLLDLGYVPAEVGERAGFDCAPALATI